MKNHIRSLRILFAAILTAATIITVQPAAAWSTTESTWAYSLCFPYAPKNVSAETGTLLITNAAANVVTLDISFLAADGTQAAALPAEQLNIGATKIVDLATVTGLPMGAYQVIATATGELAGAAHIRSGEGSVGVYRAIDCAAPPETEFGAFYVIGSAGGTSVLHVMNSSPTVATFRVDFLDNSGAVVYSLPGQAVAPRGSVSIASEDIPSNIFGQDGYGRIRISSSASAVSGVIANERNGVITFANALIGSQVAASSELYITLHNTLPRLHNRSTEVGTPFTTQLFLVNAASSGNTYNLVFYRDDGTSAASPKVFSFPEGSARLVKAILGDEFIGTASMIVAAQGPFAVQAEMVAGPGDADDQPMLSADSIVVSAYASSFLIPGVVYDEDELSVLAIQNLTVGHDPVSVELLAPDGDTVATVVGSPQPGAPLTVDLRKVAGVEQPFYGAARVRGPQEYVGQLDVYSTLARSPLAQVEIVGSDVAALPGAAVALTAVVSPTSSIKPITYTWQPDEQASQIHVTRSGQDVASFAWSSPGVKMVRVSTANSVSMAGASHWVNVPAASAVAVDGAQLILAHTDGNGPSFQLSVPVGAAVPGYTLTLTPAASSQLDAMNGAPATATLVGAGVLFDAFRDGEVLPRFSFVTPVALRMRYTNADVAGRDEGALRIWTVQDGKWIDAAETCSPASQYLRQPELNEIEVPICHLSPYALGVPGKLLYLPALERGR